MSEKNGRKFTNEEFVLAWQASDGIDDVMTRIGIDLRTVQQISLKMRKAGVALKKYKRGTKARHPIDAAALNALIEKGPK